MNSKTAKDTEVVIIRVKRALLFCFVANKIRLEKRDWTLDWTGLFLGGGGGSIIFLVCRKIAFSTFPQQAIFFHFGRGGGGGGKDFTFLLVGVLVSDWSPCLTHGRHVLLES